MGMILSDMNPTPSTEDQATNIIWAACSLRNQELSRFYSADAKREIAEVRQAVCYILDKMGMSQSDIGRAIDRHRSSVAHSIITAQSLLEYNAEFINYCKQIEKQTK
jgi:chromosomal replication initiation ATPase DnaA